MSSSSSLKSSSKSSSSTRSSSKSVANVLHRDLSRGSTVQHDDINIKNLLDYDTEEKDFIMKYVESFYKKFSSKKSNMKDFDLGMIFILKIEQIRYTKTVYSRDNKKHNIFIQCLPPLLLLIALIFVNYMDKKLKMNITIFPLYDNYVLKKEDSQYILHDNNGKLLKIPNLQQSNDVFIKNKFTLLENLYKIIYPRIYELKYKEDVQCKPPIISDIGRKKKT